MRPLMPSPLGNPASLPGDQSAATGEQESDAVRIRLLVVVFVTSGFCGVAYEVLLGRYLHLIVGNTAHAVSALLVAFLLGTSAGAMAGGRLADRSVRPLRLYAWAEAGLGLYSVAFPLVLGALQALYLDWAPPLSSQAVGRHAARFAAGVAAFLVPSFLMGVTMPAFARGFPRAVAAQPAWLVRIYAWNTLGAAAGAFATAYLLVPVLGMRGALVGLATLNACVFVIAYRSASVIGPAAPPARQASGSGGLALGALLLLAATTGVFCFSLEVVWTHLLAMLLGNSVYAFGLMLGSLLLGLGGGAALARRVPAGASAARGAAGLALILAGAFVLLTIGVWDDVPSLFLLLAKASPTFALMELTRLVVAVSLMSVPAALLGMVFPLVLRLGAGGAARVGSRIGATIAANTAGSVGGALAGPYLLLDGFGSLASLRGLAVGLLLAGAAASWWISSWPVRRVLALAAAALAVAGLVVPVHWDPASLGAAASIYLGSSEASRGRVLYWREDTAGGLTSVVERDGIRTLLTNGKFQGDDGDEMLVQHRLANVPALMNAGRERALVVGLGTGVTVSALAAHGYREVVCAEISPAIVDAARQFFGHVNRRVLDWPSVRLIEEDGRSVLLEDPRRYDVVSIEVTTIWFAGVGNIYSDDFYRLVKRRLRQGGVMLQWFPVHHLSARNLFVVVNTVRSVFPFVSVWTHRHQGFVVASSQPLAIDLESARADVARESLRPYLRDLDSGSPLELLSDLVVTDRDMDDFLDTLARLLQSDRRVVSTDSWPTLEYETPKDILSHLLTFQNRALFRRFRSARPLPFRGEPTAAESALATAAFARGWQDPLAAASVAQALGSTVRPADLASTWVVSELGDRGGGEAGSPDPGWLAHAGSALPALGKLVSAAASVECSGEDAAFDPLRSVPLLVEAAQGESLEHTIPEAATDGNASPLLGKGWRVRTTGSRITLDLRLDQARAARAVDYCIRALDGGRLTVRVFVRDPAGQSFPLAQVVEGGGCAGFRRLRLPRPWPLASLRLEVEPATRSSRVAVHEVWVEEEP
jgi:spermidine synthase